MTTIAPASPKVSSTYPSDDAPDSEIKPWTAEQVQQWRQVNPQSSPWRVIGGQLLAGLVLVVGAVLLAFDRHVVWSVGYGAMAVVIPSLLFAHGLRRQKSVGSIGAAMVGFFVWEMAKIALTVAMLAAAPKLVAGLNWLGMLIGLIVTMKVYWVMLMLRPKRGT